MNLKDLNLNERYLKILNYLIILYGYRDQCVFCVKKIRTDTELHREDTENALSYEELATITTFRWLKTETLK